MIVIGLMWWNGLLVAQSVGTAAVFVVRSVVGDRAIRWVHGLMAVGMACMFWPGGDPVPWVVGTAVFAVVGAWFAAIRLRSGGVGIDGPTRVVIGCAAMVLMYLGHGNGLGHDYGVAPAGAHAGHAGSAPVEGGSNGLVAALALLSAGYFLWQAWELGSRQPPPDAVGRVGVLVRGRAVARVEPGAHVVMSVLMAVMFLGAI